jgi:Purine nucleoside permease
MHRFFVNKDGVAGTVTGMGKARSAATLMAILKDPRFDFSKPIS